MFLKKVLPLLTIGMKVLSTAAKIAGTAIGAGGLVPNGDVLKTLGIVSKKSGDIAALLQQVKRHLLLDKTTIGRAIGIYLFSVEKLQANMTTT